MIHHLSLGTDDLARAFYDPIMALLGLRLIKAHERLAGYGTVEILFSLQAPADGGRASPGNGVHVAFQAGTRERVRAFHAIGLAHGGADDGAPGLRPDYDRNYYAAFLRDPDGNKVEAVTFAAE